MNIHLSSKPNEIFGPTFITTEVKNTRFPCCFIDKDSYIVSALVKAGLDIHFGDDLYNLQIGKYTSLAEDILLIIDMDHDFSAVCQGWQVSELRHKSFEGVVRNNVKQRKGEIIIGNDCWIGTGATIMNGVIIHDGAVVAANSVVTKDVPPYAIVGGNPAKVIKKRFADEIVEKLKWIRWWDWNEEKVLSAGSGLLSDAEVFVKEYYEESREQIIQKSERDPFFTRTVQNEKVFSYIVDYESPIASYPEIIKAFCTKFFKTNNQLVLYFPAHLTEKNKAVDVVINELEKYKDAECSVSLVYDDRAVIDSIIKNCDSYITSRSTVNVRAVGLAELFGKEIVSGFNLPIWE